mmetsp:Transcript_6819/g.14920  ORF Transcript_6819/g.14920 Transcript_6819/m.14920 type:complete len:454 (-) Transcript_6819:185-1546(-)
MAGRWLVAVRAVCSCFRFLLRRWRRRSNGRGKVLRRRRFRLRTRDLKLRRRSALTAVRRACISDARFFGLSRRSIGIASTLGLEAQALFACWDRVRGELEASSAVLDRKIDVHCRESEPCHVLFIARTPRLAPTNPELCGGDEELSVCAYVEDVHGLDHAPICQGDLELDGLQQPRRPPAVAHHAEALEQRVAQVRKGADDSVSVVAHSTGRRLVGTRLWRPRIPIALARVASAKLVKHVPAADSGEYWLLGQADCGDGLPDAHALVVCAQLGRHGEDRELGARSCGVVRRKRGRHLWSRWEGDGPSARVLSRLLFPRKDVDPRERRKGGEVGHVIDTTKSPELELDLLDVLKGDVIEIATVACSREVESFCVVLALHDLHPKIGQRPVAPSQRLDQLWVLREPAEGARHSQLLARPQPLILLSILLRLCRARVFTALVHKRARAKIGSCTAA